jgi:CheY-like chemotaxis protein
MDAAWPHVLLVNDNENGLYLLERAVLREYPAADVRKCQSAEEALGCWRNTRYDVIITDNRMPQMEGLDLVRTIRAEDGATPIMMLTGSPLVEADARAAGVSDFLSTGSWDDIRARIRLLLGEKRPE